MNATIVTVGDELLIGQVIDTNSAWMGQELNKAGIDVVRRIAVGDDEKAIVDALDVAASVSSIILITGGLGPTRDDITKHALCTYFDSSLVFDESVYEMVKGFFERLKRPMPEINRNQAEMPAKCVPIKNYNGTAPGMWFDRDDKVFVSMPGVPWEMKLMMNDVVIPRLRERFKTPFIIHKTLLTQGIGESLLAEKIQDIEDDFPAGFKLAYLPYLSSVRLRISGHGADPAVLQKTTDLLALRLQERIGEYVWGFDDDSLEKAVGRILSGQQKTLSTAESCSGGLIAYRITSCAGASAYFKGGLVCYSNQAKEELLGVSAGILQTYGAVSEETVKAMAVGARSRIKSDYSIAVSGIAGPDGGSDDKPVGTVWIAVADERIVIARKFLFPGNRERNMELSAINALSMLRKLMLGTLQPA